MLKERAPNPGKAELCKCGDNAFGIRQGNPVHGPITPDEALQRAAWLIHLAAPHSKLTIKKLVEQIKAGESEKQK